MGPSSKYSNIYNEENDIKKRNEELEKKLKESIVREKKIREELDRALERVRVAEEGEEMLCSELGQLEAEAADGQPWHLAMDSGEAGRLQ